MSAITVYLTTHAVDRYWERVKPHLRRDQAQDELERFLPMSEVSAIAPEWWVHDPGETEAVAYALLCDGIVFPLAIHGAYYTAITCGVRGGLGETARAARNSRHQSERRRRAEKRRKHPSDRRSAS